MKTLIKVDPSGRILATYQTNDPSLVLDESDGKIIELKEKREIDNALTGEYRYNFIKKKTIKIKVDLP